MRPSALHSGLIAFLAIFWGAAQLMANGHGPRFTENQGQWDDRVEYRSAVPGGFLYVENGALTYLLYEERTTRYFHPGLEEPEEGPFWFHAYRVKFEGAQSAALSGEKTYQDYENYYCGDDPEKWASRVPVHGKVRQSEIYPGTDLVIYDKMGALKYDLRLQPGADPSQISMLFEGADGLSLRNGELVISTHVMDVVEKRPFAYQFINGSIIEVSCSFVLGDDRVSFELGNYDPNFELVIDPELSFASYSGSTANNFGFTATDDEDGLLYAGSIAYNIGYPTTFGAFELDFNNTATNVIDIALSKFSEDGSQLEFSTYLGGSLQEMPHSIIVNSQNELIVMGNTGSYNFPHTFGAYDDSFNEGPVFDFLDVSFGNMTHPFGCDIFVTKFSEDGADILGSTFVGGSGNDGLNSGAVLSYNYGDVFRGEVIVDDEDNILVATVSSSSDFPIEGMAAQSVYGGGSTDAVIFKLNPDLTSMQWSTYFGGSSDDSAYSLQLDSEGNVFFAGGTKSTVLPNFANAPDNSFNGYVDGYLGKLNPDGTLLLGLTFIGTVDYDQCYFVQLDLADNPYVIGQSTGSMPVSDGVYNNSNGKQFIQKYNNDITDLIWSTTFGSGGQEIDISPCAFLVSDCDHIYVSGWGGATNNAHSIYIDASSTAGLPVTDDAFQPTTDDSDFYLMVLSPDAEDLLYATFFGGAASNEHVDGGTSKFDKNGSVYQAVCAGCGGNDDFPTTPGVWSEENGSSCNLGVFKFDLASITAVIDLNGPDVICEGQPMEFENLSSGGQNFIWHFGDGESSSETTPIHTYDAPGIYEVTLVVTDELDCVQPDSAIVEIEVLQGVNPSIDEFTPICFGDALTLQGNGSENAYWSESPTLTALDDLQASVLPSQNTTYYFVDFNDCETDSVPANVEFYEPDFDISDDISICIGTSTELEAEGGGTYSWSPTTGLDDPNASNPVAEPEETTTYSVEIVSPEGCVATDSLVVTVVNDSPGGVTYDPVLSCQGGSAFLSAEDGLAWSWSPEEFLNNPNSQNPIASVQENTLFTVEIQNACGQGTSQVWVEISIPEAIAIEDQEMCRGETIELWADGGVSFAWSPGFGINDSTLQTPLASPPISTTYTVYVTDEAGCTDDAEVNVVVHQPPEVDAGTDIEIVWYEQPILNGTAEGQFFWDPRDYVDCFNCESTPASPPESMWFYLETMDEFGCTNRDSVFVELLGPLFVPNSFTPDYDGVNDIFLPQSIGLKDYHLQIFNRWGELLFETDKLDKGWDGTFKGSRAQMDVYVWRIKYRDPVKGDRIIIGHVNLIR